MTGRLTILIVGGYGTFGGRLAGLLADEPRLTLVIAGRSLARASRFCATLPAAARLVPAAFDRDRDPAAAIAALAPDTVVDATGPFQSYGADPYRLVRACIATGTHYLDFADAAGFVSGIAAFDAAARERGIHVLSGVSSFPVLTSAAARRLGRDFGRVDTITGGIAPSPHAGVGLNVIRAVAGYAGRPTRIWRDGAWATAFPLTETRRVTIAPPGHVPLRSTLFSLVEVPDLVLVPALRPEVRSVWMGAGPVPALLHRMLIGLAWLVRLRALPSLGALAPLLLAALGRLRRGEHRGGMFVELEGVDPSGAALAASWHLLAEGEAGPLIPSMAVEAILRKRLEGAMPRPGARPATDALELDDYEGPFARRRIATGFRSRSAASERLPLYRRILGEAWPRLPDAIRALHAQEGSTTLEGRGSVERGSHPLARLVAVLFGFPPSASDLPVSVTFARSGGTEVWHRRFGPHGFKSVQAARAGRWRHLLVESFGPFSFGLALVVEGGRLHFVVRRWALLGVPLPLRLAPTSRSWEAEAAGRFTFHVELAHPALGTIVRYEGWLSAPPEACGAAPAARPG